MKKVKKKDKNLMCKQYPHHIDIDFLSIESTNTYLLLSTIPTHSSHFCKLTTFVIIELFFLHNQLTLKTLCNLTSSS